MPVNGIFCTGTMSLQLTTDGYDHAEVVGTGLCSTTSGIEVDVVFDGEGFQVNPYSVNIVGAVYHTTLAGDMIPTTLISGDLSYDTATSLTSIELEWSLMMPISGALIPLDGKATSP